MGKRKKERKEKTERERWTVKERLLNSARIDYHDLHDFLSPKFL